MPSTVAPSATLMKGFAITIAKESQGSIEERPTVHTLCQHVGTLVTAYKEDTGVKIADEVVKEVKDVQSLSHFPLTIPIQLKSEANDIVDLDHIEGQAATLQQKT